MHITTAPLSDIIGTIAAGNRVCRESIMQARAELDRRFPVLATLPVEEAYEPKDASATCPEVAMAKTLAAHERTITDQRATIRELGRRVELAGISTAEQGRLAKARDAEIARLRERLTACESLLKAERATVARLTADHEHMTVRHASTLMELFGTKCALDDAKRSALVIPATVLDRRPLPWRYDSAVGGIWDVTGTFVSSASGTLGPIIVAAANGSVKS